jgi:hypothetical protein
MEELFYTNQFNKQNISYRNMNNNLLKDLEWVRGLMILLLVPTGIGGQHEFNF